MQAVILLGGEGTRLKPLLGDLPKALVEIQGKPLLEYLLILLRHQKILDVVMCTGYGWEQIQAWAGDGSRFDLSIRYSRETQPLGTAGALKNISLPLEETFLLLYGDVLVWMDLNRLVRYHVRKEGLATLVVHPSSHPYDSDLVVMNEQGLITGFPGRPRPGDAFTNLTNAALYVMESSCLAYIAEGRKSDLGRDVFPEMLRSGARLFGYSTDEYLKDAGTPERLEQVKQDLLQGRFQCDPAYNDF